MDNIIFCKSFSFRTIKLKAFSHTDNSKGIKSSFFAKMKKGTGRILTLSGEELCVSEGDIFYLPLGLCYHSYWNPGDDGDVEWDSFSFEFLPLVGGERFVMQKLNCDEEDRKIFDSINKNDIASPEDVGHLYLFASHVLPHMKRDFDRPSDKLLEKAKKYISENLDFKVSELARFCNMSESSLYAFFREHAKITPIEMKQQLQLERAVFLLGSTDLSVEQIAGRSGFHSAAYFRKIFKEQLGISPTEKRKELYFQNRL